MFPPDNEHLRNLKLEQGFASLELNQARLASELRIPGADPKRSAEFHSMTIASCQARLASIEGQIAGYKRDIRPFELVLPPIPSLDNAPEMAYSGGYRTGLKQREKEQRAEWLSRLNP
jgi:hypothetical protein